MVLDYYKLQEQPFGVTPDSRYLVLTPTHKEALDSLIYGIESGCGFVALIATPGLGKTTLLFEALSILRDKARIVFLFQTISTPLDLLRALLSGLGVRDLQGSLVEMQIRLKDLLTEQFRQGKRVVVVIDEAQNLDDSVLELVRMLSNFETARDKLIQIILAGQPQLAENIGSPELVQLRQRISIFASLRPFTPEETAGYINHRLRTAGYASDMPLFTKDALALISLCSEGIPRNINNLCFNALSLGSALQQKPIDRDVIRQVIADLDLGPLRKKGHLQLPPVEEISGSRVPAMFATAEPSPSMFAGWIPRAAVAFVVLLAVAGSLFEGRHWLARSATPQSAAAASVQPAATGSSPVVPDSLPPVSSDPPGASASEPPLPAVKSEPSFPGNSLPPDPAVATAADPAAAVQTNRPLPPPISPASTLLSADKTAQTADSVGVVEVAPGQTLLGICTEKFGTCTAQLLQQIHELNPRMNDPDHIETGQKLRLPVLAAQSNGGEPRKNSERGTHE
jgi:general secretion pathway protein A